ncbi:MAG: cupin domain-containing protein [Syntrophaceae bacterium]|nr:cupin domain-containing protein [Syntrophaceae bacterium]
MRFPDFIEKLPQADFPASGAEGYLLQAKEHQVVFLRLEKDIEIPEHSHAAQWEIPLEGTAEVAFGGQVQVFGPGQPFHIPAGVAHSGKVKSPYAAIIVFDAPDRYRLKK